MGFQTIRARIRTFFREEVLVSIQAGTSEIQEEPQSITDRNVSQNFGLNLLIYVQKKYQKFPKLD